MTTKVVRIDVDVLDDLNTLKVILKMSRGEVIRTLMNRSSYTETFFEKMRQILEDPYEKQAFDKRARGDSPD